MDGIRGFFTGLIRYKYFHPNQHGIFRDHTFVICYASMTHVTSDIDPAKIKLISQYQIAVFIRQNFYIYLFKNNPTRLERCNIHFLSSNR